MARGWPAHPHRSPDCGEDSFPRVLLGLVLVLGATPSDLYALCDTTRARMAAKLTQSPSPNKRTASYLLTWCCFDGHLLLCRFFTTSLCRSLWIRTAVGEDNFDIRFCNTTTVFSFSLAVFSVMQTQERRQCQVIECNACHCKPTLDVICNQLAFVILKWFRSAVWSENF